MFLGSWEEKPFAQQTVTKGLLSLCRQVDCGTVLAQANMPEETAHFETTGEMQRTRRKDEGAEAR